MPITDTLAPWLATLYLPEIGPRKLSAWFLQLGGIENLFSGNHDLLQSIGINDNDIATLQHPNWKAVEKDLAWAEKENHHIITWDDEDYPLLLKEMPDPPFVLFVRGNRQVLSQKQIAIVGSRSATQVGLSNAEQFSHALAKAGFVITSGLALGIDGRGHRGALNAGGFTIGVAGTGLLRTYPASHQKLAEEMIAKGGAIVSEFPLDTPPHPWNFPRRNRIIAGLSLGVLVIEAALKSGSLITARLAIDSGREVFAIPGSIHNALARGCHHLIRQGAKLVETANDIIEELGALQTVLDIAKTPQIKDTAPPMSEKQTQVFAQIGHEITPLDTILGESQLTAGEVSSILLVLELNGHIQSVPGGYKRL